MRWRHLVLWVAVSLFPFTAIADDHGSPVDWEKDFAVRLQGYIGVGVLDFDPGGKEEAFQGGGAGSLSFVRERFYGQFDIFGDSQDFDGGDTSGVGFGMHGGVREADRFRVGAVLTYGSHEIGSADVDVFRIGGEGEYYFDRLTVDASIGYQEFDTPGGDADAFFFDAGLDVYPSDNVRMELGAGVVDIEDTDPIGLVNLGIEALLGTEIPMSLFTRWEGSFLDDSTDIEQHSIVAGVKVYWGGGETTLIGYDRNRFKRSCQGLLTLFTRAC